MSGPSRLKGGDELVEVLVWRPYTEIIVILGCVKRFTISADTPRVLRESLHFVAQSVRMPTTIKRIAKLKEKRRLKQEKKEEEKKAPPAPVSYSDSSRIEKASVIVGRALFSSHSVALYESF